MEVKNKCTLLIDGNWLLMWRLFGCQEYCQKCNIDSGMYTKEEAKFKIKERLAQAISYKLYQLKDIVDNFIYISDDSSWRKDLNIPQALKPEFNKYIDKEITYKGQRVKDDTLDWDIIYSAHKEFITSLENAGICCSHLSKIEGDDWVYWWSNYLNNNNINVIIWTKDQDLKQLVKYNEQTDIFTIWMNDDNGIFLAEELRNLGINKSDDIMDLFVSDFDSQSRNQYIYKLKQLYKNTGIDIRTNYINPMYIIIEKIISGDVGDNIQPIIYKMSDGKNSKDDKQRRYKATEKDVIAVIDTLSLKNIKQCFDKKDTIISYLLSIKKFKDICPDIKVINEHFDYNKQLVWLEESQYPEKILLSFLQIPYKVINDITQYYNYKQLIPDSEHINYIENLYQQI